MTNDYTIPIFEIVSTEFREFTVDRADIYNKLAKKCVNMDKACHTYFSGKGIIFVMNCYDLQTLFISYITFLKHSSSFCAQVELS